MDKTPSQRDVLDSFDDWRNVVLDLMAASINLNDQRPGLEADALLLDDARRDLGVLAAPRITVDQTGPATAKPGDVVTYSVRVANSGRGPAIAPLLEQTNPDGIATSFDLGLVAVGSESTQVRSFTVPATACPGDFKLAAAAVSFKDFPGQPLSAATTTALQVLDVAAPTVDISLSPNVLWPPNHGFVEVTATVTVADTCERSPQVTLLSITSNEPESGFLGHGDEGPDIQGAEFMTDDRTFSLRAERGTGQESAGRVYTVTYIVSDGSGNSTMRSAIVTVPTSNR